MAKITGSNQRVSSSFNCGLQQYGLILGSGYSLHYTDILASSSCISAWQPLWFNLTILTRRNLLFTVYILDGFSGAVS